MSSHSRLPINYIGHYDVAAEGKFLWEILCQLRNMGVGRYVTKTEWCKKWPDQSSYLKIIKARPKMDRWLHEGKLWADWTFRGRHLGTYEFSHDLNRSDWKLIHKNEEKNYLKNTNQMSLLQIPNTIPLPPLQRYMAKKKAEKDGKIWNEFNERIPNELCIDPQFEFLRPFIQLTEPKQKLNSIYDENDPEVYLDLYGELLPTKVEAWMLGPAEKGFKFMPNQVDND